MNHHRQTSAHTRTALDGALLGALALILLAAGVRADVFVAIRPAPVIVQPGEVFEVEVTITESGSDFNGYDAVIGYDPQFLTFLPRSQAEQEGELMTEACPERFHVFTASPETGILSVAHVLLCAGVSVAGPGVVYRLQFQAGEDDGTTAIRLLDDTAFYLAGTFVTPVHTEDATVQIGTDTGVESSLLVDPRLRVTPNPFNPRVTFTFDASQASSVHLAVYDLRGRRRRTLLADRVEAGRHTVGWSGRDDAGIRLGSGVYLVRLDLAGRRTTTMVTMVQ